MLDDARIAELGDEIGPEDFAEVLALFLEEIDEELSRFDIASPPDRVAAQLHALKGSARNIGFSAFADLCEQAETGGVSSELGARLRATLDQSKRMISVRFPP